MKIQKRTLIELREVINEKTGYRKGSELVSFFNDLGFMEEYGQGFPSRWAYTDEKLEKINGSHKMKECIEKAFAPIDYIGKFDDLDQYIHQFNQYLSFDGYNIVRKDNVIEIVNINELKEKVNKTEEISEDQFLKQEFKDINLYLSKIGLETTILDVLKGRLSEIQQGLNYKIPLSIIFMCGSTLEGILLGVANNNPKDFNTATSAPKDTQGNIKKFNEWNLNNLIDTGYELGLLKDDVKKFSHILRDFRNYIHPYQQLLTGFNPDIHTAKICRQVLQAAIYQLSK